MIIYDEIFGEYFIKVAGVGHYKVFKKRKCIKLDVYKDIKANVENLTEDDFNYYEIRVSSTRNLMSAVIFIYEQNFLYPKQTKTTKLYQLLKALNDFCELL